MEECGGASSPEAVPGEALPGGSGEVGLGAGDIEDAAGVGAAVQKEGVRPELHERREGPPIGGLGGTLGGREPEGSLVNVSGCDRAGFGEAEEISKGKET